MLLTKEEKGKLIGKYGYLLQTIKTIEELSELQKALCKYVIQQNLMLVSSNNEQIKHQIEEEYYDCLIMLEQIQDIFSIDNKKLLEEKLSRLRKRLEE